MAGRTPQTSSSLPLLEGPGEVRVRTWVQFVRTFMLLQRRVVSVLATHEITLPQFDVLATLRFSEGVTQQELAERLLVTKGNVCGLIDRLEGLGWMQRRPDAKDGRINRLHLTDLGRKKIAAILPEHDALVSKLMAGLSTQEVKALRTLVRKLEDASAKE